MSKLRRFTYEQLMRIVPAMIGKEKIITSTTEDIVEHFERMLRGEDRGDSSDFATKIEDRQEYIQDEYGISLPDFIFKGAYFAAAFKWYIITYNKPLRDLKDKLYKAGLSKKGQEVDEKIEDFQEHIDAVSCILTDYYMVDTNLKSWDDHYNQIDFWLRTEPKYLEFRKMFEGAEKLLAFRPYRGSATNSAVNHTRI